MTWLISNNTLTDLYLDHTNIKWIGLKAMSSVLESPKSGLRLLSLRSNMINNRGAILLANSLMNNSTLTMLYLEDDTTITSKGWKVFCKILCRKTSIMETYNSNHTLAKLVVDEWILSDELMSLLLMNRDSKRHHDVARQKIIKCHFSDGKMDMQPFIDMKVGVLPCAVSWMGSDEIPLLYQFIRNMQSFFDFGLKLAREDGPVAKWQKT